MLTFTSLLFSVKLVAFRESEQAHFNLRDAIRRLQLKVNSLLSDYTPELRVIEFGCCTAQYCSWCCNQLHRRSTLFSVYKRCSSHILATNGCDSTRETVQKYYIPLYSSLQKWQKKQ